MTPEKEKLVEQMRIAGADKIHASAYHEDGSIDYKNSGYLHTMSDEAANELSSSLRRVNAGNYFSAQVNHKGIIRKLPKWLYRIYAHVDRAQRMLRIKFSKDRKNEGIF